MRSSYKTIGLWVILIILFVAFYNFFSHTGDEVVPLTFTSFQTKVKETGKLCIGGAGAELAGAGKAKL